jgi:hypothetical protein
VPIDILPLRLTVVAAEYFCTPGVAVSISWPFRGAVVPGR